MAHMLNNVARITEFHSAKEYTIGDLAREFGVTLRTLRFYEDKGLLLPGATGVPASTTAATAHAFPLS